MRTNRLLSPFTTCLATWLLLLGNLVSDGHEVEVHRDISYNAVDILDIGLLNRFRAEIGQGSIDEDTFPQYCYHA
ncbi:MAG: hypothetical protein VX496_08450, partial [Planctomycetota bacterium]|nr:hypothetical protein [Planctomycetota bacterium]